MATETERKFLISNSDWRKSVYQQKQIAQGYLSTNPVRTVRIRISDQIGIITIKGKSEGISRQEFEYEIPLDDAKALIKLCERSIIEKTRNLVKYQDKTWEIDEFYGDNAGLIVAEVELNDEKESIEIPDWIGNEVSGQRRYYNASLIQYPFKKWSQEGLNTTHNKPFTTKS